MMAIFIKMLVRRGVVAAVVAGAGLVLPSAQSHASLRNQESRPSAPIVLAQEQRMIRCTDGCDRELRRCGRSRHCRAEHDACIRACI
jgi:hypothetical protein